MPRRGTAALYEERDSGPPMTGDALATQFETGLQALLDGLAVRMMSG